MDSPRQPPRQPQAQPQGAAAGSGSSGSGSIADCGLQSALSSPVLKAVRTVPADKAAALETLIRGSWAPNAIYSLCRLGVPDALSEDPASALSAAELAARLDCSAPCLLRLLRLCAAYGLLVERARRGGGGDGGGGDGGGSDGGGGGDGKSYGNVDRGGQEAAAAASAATATAAERTGSSGSSSSSSSSCEGMGGDSGSLSRGSSLATTSTGTSTAATAAASAAATARAAAAAAAAAVCREARTFFHLTDTGAMLKESHPSCMHWLALMLGLPGHYVSRGHLYDNVKQGRMGFETAFGCDWYTYVSRHPLERRAFDAAMTATSTAAAQAVAAGYDFGRHATVMDVGGGQGLLMAAVLHAHPGVRAGYVMELPAVVAAARRLGQRGMERLSYVEGDFFHPFPRPADGAALECCVMRLVLHDWTDEDAVKILRHARDALLLAPASPPPPATAVAAAAAAGGDGPAADASSVAAASSTATATATAASAATTATATATADELLLQRRLLVVEAVLPELVTPAAAVAAPPATAEAARGRGSGSSSSGGGSCSGEGEGAATAAAAAATADLVQRLEFDMGMMLMTQGRERSLSEWRALLRAGGFTLERLTLTGSSSGSSSSGSDGGGGGEPGCGSSSSSSRMPRLPVLVARPLLDHELGALAGGVAGEGAVAT